MNAPEKPGLSPFETAVRPPAADPAEAARHVGARVARIEDDALLRGQGRYLDDIMPEGALHAVFVRSPEAHALIRGIDAEAARTMPGVRAIYTAADLEPLLHGHGLRLPIAFPKGQLPDHVMPYVLPPAEACYVGEALAMVVADSRRLAEDAAQAVELDLEPLPAVVDCRDGLRADAPPSRVEAPDNLIKKLQIRYGDGQAAFAGAARVLRDTLHVHRGSGSPMEGRGIVADYDRASDSLTVWSSTQMSHELYFTLCEMLGLDENQVRVRAPDVGGAFGAKYLVYPEEIAVTAASLQLARPVKWVEDRREHFVSAVQERDQFWEMEIAVHADGRIAGVRGTLTHDQGAYAPHSYVVPYNAATSAPGPYVVPAFDLDVLLVQTNKVPVIPIRGAGHPQGNFVMERLLDRVALELGLDRAEVRRRNLIPADRMPYATPLKNRAGAPIVYDSGDYLACQERALEAIGYAGFRERQRAARAQGRRIGIGIAQGVKGTGRGPFESGTVRVMPTGRVSVYTGALEMGQGIQTGLAQICADELGVPIDRIDVIAGDTRFVSLGMGGYASRQAITAGSAVLVASRIVRDKALKVAAQMFGVDQARLALRDGAVHVAGEAGKSVSLADIARWLRGLPGYGFPDGVEPGLEGSHNFRIDSQSYANAVHACEVEVDADTGAVSILRYVAVQDSGRLLNPMIAEGQIHGSVVHGIGNALYEWMGYDESGQPLTTTFGDYLLPTAPEMPNVEVIWHQTPTSLNPLGIKGVAEAGIVCVTSCLASAIDDALADYGVRVLQAPISPVQLLALIDAGGQSQATGSRP
ncbi:xanthine dehydrogenase family protein molybdopterin-binding subunit [Pigmentiphaga soli]|uniref:Xanthine dehydrogenase family protein molybdopterin-binding subunit n=1 Tax=Pigmentiphaga soli TaxID=1007095 RepID=A0ABP8HRZ2_9BURK